MGLVRRFDRWWMAPVPAQRLAALRILVGGFTLLYLVFRSYNLLGYATFPASRFEPVGVLAWMPGPWVPAVVYVLFAGTLALAFAFFAGWRFRWTGPALAASYLVLTTYRNSWGMIFHTENLVSLHLWALAFAPASDAWSVDSRGREVSEPAAQYGWAIRLMCVLTVITYVIAGLAKLRNVDVGWGFEWASGDILRTHVAYDNLRKIEMGDIYSPLGAAAVRHGWLFPPLAWASLLLEVGAPAALLGGRVGRLWVLGAWSFHVGVWALMAIMFPYPMFGVAYASFTRAERITRWRAGASIVRRLRGLDAQT